MIGRQYGVVGWPDCTPVEIRADASEIGRQYGVVGWPDRDHFDNRDLPEHRVDGSLLPCAPVGTVHGRPFDRLPLPLRRVRLRHVRRKRTDPDPVVVPIAEEPLRRPGLAARRAAGKDHEPAGVLYTRA